MLRNIAKIAKFPTLSSNVINVAARSVTFGKAAKLEAPAPKFEGVAALPDLTLKKISLDDYKGKYLVFFWYPKDFTFVCPTEIIEFSERADEFRAINCEVLGASIDSENVHQAWIQTDRKKGGLGPMKIPLLADVSRKISEDYGALMDPGFTCRATYIIDDKGTLKHASFNSPAVGRNVEEVLRLVKGYQFVAANGEVCPANWKPGKATIKPSLAGAKDFFEKQN